MDFPALFYSQDPSTKDDCSSSEMALKRPLNARAERDAQEHNNASQALSEAVKQPVLSNVEPGTSYSRNELVNIGIQELTAGLYARQDVRQLLAEAAFWLCSATDNASAFPIILEALRRNYGLEEYQ